MAVYCGIFIWSVINATLIQFKPKRNWLYYVLVLLPPVLFATIRYNIGTDYMNYWYYYNGAGNYYSYEPLFRLLNVIARNVFHGFYGVLLLSALLTYGFLLASLVKLKDHISISMALWVYYCYYYVASFNVMRQLIAVSIILYATVLLAENKKIIFVVLVIVASLFHTSAILTLVFLLLKQLQNVKVRHHMVLIFSGAVLLIFSGGVLLNSFGGFMGDYSKYLSHSNGIVSFAYLIDILPTFLVVAIPIFIYIYYYRSDREFDLYCIIGLFSIVVLIIGYHFSWFQRVLYYFDIMQVLVVAINTRRIRLPQNRLIVKSAIFIFYLFYFWYSSVYIGSNGGVPYQSFLF